MLDDAKNVLDRLRKAFAAAAETAYGNREAAESGGKKEAYAAGEGHAYAIAEDEIRKAEKANKPPDNG